MKEYVFYGEYSGELCRSKSLKEIYYASKNVKEMDKQHRIKDNYYYEIEFENGDKDDRGRTILYIQDVKIYKRGNKIYCKAI